MWSCLLKQVRCARCTCHTMCHPACMAAGRTPCTCSRRRRRRSTGSPASAPSGIDADKHVPAAISILVRSLLTGTWLSKPSPKSFALSHS